MSGTGQFNEYLPLVQVGEADDTYTPLAAVAMAPLRTDAYRLDGILASNSDGVDHELTLSLPDEAGTHHSVASVTLLAGCGHGIVPFVDVLAALSPSYALGVSLPGGATWEWFLAATPVAGTLVVVWAVGGYLG